MRVRGFAASLFQRLIAAPIASADALRAVAPSSPDDTVLVPRITKGAHGTVMRVKRDSPAARIFLAAQSGAKAQAKSGFCPGTICPKTRTCYATKGALGAGCITG
ncbi:MAG: hypothetical protein KY445_02225 [Armatimonadetes bacterium]|nr:hypothetical protein [Armatimonadota bacterium]